MSNHCEAYIHIHQRCAKGGSAENPPVIENLAKSSPVRQSRTPLFALYKYIGEKYVGENFLGFSREFSGKFRVFREISGISRNFQGNFP